MALDLDTLVKQLTESSIIAQGKLENFVPPKAQPKNADELIAQLVKSGDLTQFQATQIKAGKAKALILGGYTIVDRIGAGGMGQVFKAQHRRMKRMVAIKMLPPSLTKDAAALARFQREVEAAAKLRHTNIVAADDADEANGVHFLVMEYIDGCDLSALVKKGGPLPINKAVNYILQAARGLEFAHSKGVIHRDIKPANLLLSNDGVVKILDMGLARIDQNDGAAQSDLTGTGTVMGTIDYMAPEQALNTKHADQRADIYSLGISLFYLLAGKAAYSGDTVMEKLLAHREAPIPSLQEVQTTIPKPLQAIFEKMVAKRSEDRYQSMTEVIEGLESLGMAGSKSSSGEGASTLSLSEAERRRLATGSKSSTAPLSALTKVVAGEKSRNFLAKVIGGSFVTIIAPILVVYLTKYLEKGDAPAQPPAAQSSANATTTTASAKAPDAVAMTNGPATAAQPVGASGGTNRSWETPEFQKWVADTQKLPAGQQVEAVSKKLMELNPGFDGKVTSYDAKGPLIIAGGEVTEIGLITDNVRDISPVRALLKLNKLQCSGSKSHQGKLSDLSPLKGLRLTELSCGKNELSDLSPLQGMPLTNLAIGNCDKVSDLSPLRGLPLSNLNCNDTQVSDPSPLQDCKSLKTLGLSHAPLTPAAVAALRQALPNCRIGWDDPAKPKNPEPATSGKK